MTKSLIDYYSGVNDEICELIRTKLKSKFYLEGKNKDYCFEEKFGCITLLYSDFENISANSLIARVIRSTLEESFGELISDSEDLKYDKYNYSYGKHLEETALRIPFTIHRFYAEDNEGESYAYHFCVGKKGVLEESMKKEPERWKESKSTIEDYIHEFDGCYSATFNLVPSSKKKLR